MSALYGVYGASGAGRGIMPLVRAAYGVAADARCVFIDDAPAQTAINGHAICTWAEFLAEPATTRSVVIGIASGQVRATLDARCAAAGVAVISVQAANVVVMDDVTIGAGAVLSPFVTITSNVRIGRCFHANLYSYVEHDCVIGDYVTFAPGVQCTGNVVIEDHAYIGAGAMLRQGKPGAPLIIGRGAVVGMGAVVTKSVPAGATVAGNPARNLVKG